MFYKFITLLSSQKTVDIFQALVSKLYILPKMSKITLCGKNIAPLKLDKNGDGEWGRHATKIKCVLPAGFKNDNAKKK